MMERRVAVTGIGVVSAFGDTFGEFWKGVASGRSGIRPMTPAFRSALRFANAAEAAQFDARSHFEEKQIDYLDRFAQFAVVAAREAVKSSGLKISGELGRRTAVVTGSSAGGQGTEDQNFYNLYALKHTRFSPLIIPRVMGNAGASIISSEFGIGGPVYTVSTACSSANHAIGQAFWMVRSGVVDVALAGGSEAPFSMGLLKSWEALRVVSPDTCRPFSRDRRGLILGEGAGIVVLEALEAARARGAPVWGEIAGFGMSSDGHHLTQPLAEGAASAMRAALADAGIAPEAIGYINAHGTGTFSNDATECQAIREVFGAHAERLLVSSTKSMHGHALGAAGALEAAATLAALRSGTIPPTANFTSPDPACDLDVVPNHPRPAEIEWALSNSFAFGGLNAVLAFRSASAGR
ncbi:MAG TPA: beta-ketoacyl-[acyl-carrier-protein] synthase family protein [Bryobacteraceae bacterium]|nr:beta-ketoacyl-[acyl-carrier-protein] synthase family protein [Bryobacteraceae bacterium]